MAPPTSTKCHPNCPPAGLGRQSALLDEATAAGRKLTKEERKLEIEKIAQEILDNAEYDTWHLPADYQRFVVTVNWDKPEALKVVEGRMHTLLCNDPGVCNIQECHRVNGYYFDMHKDKICPIDPEDKDGGFFGLVTAELVQETHEVAREA